MYLYDNSYFDDYLTKWKEHSFYITEMNKKYSYPYFINHYLKNNKQCIKDSYNDIFLKMKNVQLIILNLMNLQILY